MIDSIKLTRRRLLGDTACITAAALASSLMPPNLRRALAANPAPASLQNIKHVVLLMQENRSFDHYFGALRQYWAQNGYPDQSFDGLPQFNPTSGATPLQGPAPTNPGCDPSAPPPSDCA